MNLQRTLKNTVKMTGVGLHSGKSATLNIRPAKPNDGISFLRTDIPGAKPILAHYKNVVNTQLATTLGRGEIRVSTVEHLMAALFGAGIDNALIEVDGPEVPILDGSSMPFFEAIREVGTVTQAEVKPVLSLRRKVEVKVGEKWAVAEPSAQLEIQCSIDWDHPAIGFQEFHFVGGRTPFQSFASARTFGFMKDYEAMKKLGLARGGSLDNAVVLNESQVINPSGLRYPDEFARHKVLDAIGDIKLAGVDLCAFIRLHRAGHDLHTRLLSAIFRDPDNFELIDESQMEALLLAQSTRLIAATAS